jgi:hydrogenase maturation protease
LTATGEIERRSGSRGGADPRTEPTVDVLVCGSIDRGDDRAPFAACALLMADGRTNARIRRVGQLAVDDLLAIRPGAGVVIVDAATCIDPGVIVELPLHGLLGNALIQPRSAQALAIPEVIGLVDILRGRPLTGLIVVIGARRFARGRPLTRRVAAAVPELSIVIRTAVERVAATLKESPDRPSPQWGR